MSTRILQITTLVAVMLLVAACDQASEHEYLTKEIPPCTPVSGSIVDPCDPAAKRISFSLARIHRRTALGTALEEARGCSSESEIMVL